MIDGIKLYAKIEDVDYWKASVDLNFLTEVNTKTGEVGQILVLNDAISKNIVTNKCQIGQYNLILKHVITICRGETLSNVGHLIIRGSLHKNHYKGQNYSDFSFSQIRHEIGWISEKTKISPENLIFVNIEFGLNIEFHKPVFDFISSCLVSYKSHQFNKYAPDSSGKCIGYYCPLKQYSLKIYDKSKQFGLIKNILRIELRYIKMAPLKKTGIYCLKDISNPTILRSLYEKLKIAWKHVLVFEGATLTNNYCKSGITAEFILNAQNPKFWEKLKKDPAMNYFYYRKKFKNFLVESGCSIQNDLLLKMDERFDALIIS